MNALRPKADFITDELNAERLTPIQFDGIIRAIDKYAKHYYETMQANEFEKPQEQCIIPDVSGSALLNELMPLLISYFYPTTPVSNSDEMFKKRMQIIKILNGSKKF